MTTKTKKVTIPDILSKKRAGNPITMITAYDYPGARLVDASGVDCILVGDSLAMTVLGHASTTAVTMQEMLHHCAAVRRGTQRAFLIGDMPFMSYQASDKEAVRNAGRFVREAGVEAVKLEGGAAYTGTIRAIDRAGIPVVGHLGLTPQSVTKLGGYRLQGKTADTAEKLYRDALAIQEAGCIMMILEMVPVQLAQFISSKLQVPTIGIGAGAGCDGQVLVYHDLLGMDDEFKPKFLKHFADLKTASIDAFKKYIDEVSQRKYPDADHSFKMDEHVFQQFLDKVGG